MRWAGLRPFEDDERHLALVSKTLRLEPTSWSQVVQRWCDETPADAGVEVRLSSLQRAFDPVSGAQPAPAGSGTCGLCGGRVTPTVFDGALLVGRCEACGHGVVLRGGAAADVYDRRYYDTRRPDGVGYDSYLADRAYREEKGRQVVGRLLAQHGGSPRTMLEVGSGFGFTRASARDLGLDSAGVDVNAAAVDMARRLYGFETVHGTSRDVAGTFDLVLYQFVLEHIADITREVATAFARTAPGGLACFVVPSMDATERLVFGPRYRSLRADHLHLFSGDSLRGVLGRAGFVEVMVHSECRLHLLRGFLSSAECHALYAGGLGPDFVATARRP